MATLCVQSVLVDVNRSIGIRRNPLLIDGLTPPTVQTAHSLSTWVCKELINRTQILSNFNKFPVAGSNIIYLLYSAENSRRSGRQYGCQNIC